MTRGAIYRREEGDRGDDEALVSQRHSGWRDGPPRRRGHVRTVTFTYVILPTLMRSRTRWELKRFTNSNVFQFDSCGDLLRMNSTSIWGFKKKSASSLSLYGKTPTLTHIMIKGRLKMIVRGLLFRRESSGIVCETGQVPEQRWGMGPCVHGKRRPSPQLPFVRRRIFSFFQNSLIPHFP